MTFKTLCQRLRQEAGIAGVGPPTVIDQTGEAGRIVDWVSSVYQCIQNLHSTWLFLQKDFSFSTVASTQNYTKTELALTDLSTWGVNDVRAYLTEADEQYLTYFPWSEFKALYMFGSLRSQEGKPTIFTVKPDNSISFYPIPDEVYTVNGEYSQIAHTMVVDDDEPIIPDDYQMAIIWKGLMLYGAYTGATDSYAHGQNESRSIMRKLEANQLPKIAWGKPLC